MPRDVQVSAQGRDEFLTASGDTSDDPVTPLQFNSWVCELLALGDVFLDPSMIVERPPTNATIEQIVTLPQSGGLRAVGSKWNSLWSLHPEASGLTRAEIERRQWAWAVLGMVRGSLDDARYSGSSSGLLIPTTGAVRVMEPATAYIVNVAVAVRKSPAIMQVSRGAELYLGRLVQWRQTGTMPAAGDLENSDQRAAAEVAAASWNRWGNQRSAGASRGQNAVGVLAALGLAWLAFGGKDG